MRRSGGAVLALSLTLAVLYRGQHGVLGWNSRASFERISAIFVQAVAYSSNDDILPNLAF